MDTLNYWLATYCPLFGGSTGICACATKLCMRCVLIPLGPPYIYSGTYTYSTTTASIVRLECQSYNSIPKVTWLRNGDEVDVDNDKYEVVDMVNTRGSLSRSYFRSILIVRSLLRGLGTQNYTCLFENTFGNSSRNIQFQRPGRPYIHFTLKEHSYHCL